MSSVMNIALSGVRASALRASVSANNIANSQSIPTRADGVSQVFMPTDVVQVPDQSGGTIAYTQPSDKSPVNLFDPTSGRAIQAPNIDLAEELVKVQQASVNYTANLKVINTAASLLGKLVDFSA